MHMPAYKSLYSPKAQEVRGRRDETTHALSQGTNQDKRKERQEEADISLTPSQPLSKSIMQCMHWCIQFSGVLVIGSLGRRLQPTIDVY